MRQRGFTLLEVMIGLALLGLALTVLIKSAAGSIFNAEQARMMGIATDLARAKIYDVEEILLKDGFTDTDQSQEDEKCFDDEGWPNICYSYKVEEAELPSFDQLQAMSQKQAEKALAAAGGSAGSALEAGEVAGGFENSGLGSMLGMMGAVGGGGTDIDVAQGASVIQSQYSMFQEVLKVSVRKVTVTVKWKVHGRDRDMKVVAFFTDPVAMDKVIGSMGATPSDSGGTPGGTPGGGSPPPSSGRPPPGGGRPGG